jgi:hypothetical protein
MDHAVKKRIKHLCGYITDRTAVMQHINREFNINLTLRDLDAVAKAKERPTRTSLEAMMPSPLIVTHKRKGYDDLAVALFKYHAARSFGSDQSYWLARLNDKRAKPITTVEI